MMRKLNMKEIGADMLHDESGTANLNWLSIGLAVLLFLLMTRLEGLLFCCTGRGFLQP